MKELCRDFDLSNLYSIDSYRNSLFFTSTSFFWNIKVVSNSYRYLMLSSVFLRKTAKVYSFLFMYELNKALVEKYSICFVLVNP